MPHSTENELIKTILDGEREYYRLLVEKYQQAIFRVCMGYVHDEDDANDLTQETFIRAYEKLSDFGFNSAFFTWLYRIAMNVSLNHLRQKRRNIFDRLGANYANKAHLNEIIDSNLNPEELYVNQEIRSAIQYEIDALSDKQKSAFILSKYDHRSQKEIAEIMGITEGAVESLIQRAKVNLQKNLVHFLKKNSSGRRKNK